MLHIFFLLQVTKWKTKSEYYFDFLEKLHFFGNDPQNTSVEIGKTAVLNCRVQTNDPTTKILWLKKLNIQQLFRPDAIVFGSEQYENIEQFQGQQSQQYSNNILSKPLVLAQVTDKEIGQYICLIQNDKATNYKKAFINVIDDYKGKNYILNRNKMEKFLLERRKQAIDIHFYCFRQQCIVIHIAELLT
jgi:hypothetical protein